MIRKLSLTSLLLVIVSLNLLAAHYTAAQVEQEYTQNQGQLVNLI